jgi:signal transduction histidine kinase
MTPALELQLESELSETSVLRALAHEIRQPLSAIESIAFYLSLSLPGNEKQREQFARLQQLVEQSNWILSNGLSLADARHAVPEAIDLEELITQTIAARPASLDPPAIIELAGDLPLVRLDPGLGRALIENIFGLFRQLATAAHPVRVGTSAVSGMASNMAVFEVSTSAPGYRSIPALPPGSALSLDSAQRIAALHGGSCTCSVDPLSGIRVRVMLP